MDPEESSPGAGEGILGPSGFAGPRPTARGAEQQPEQPEQPEQGEFPTGIVSAASRSEADILRSLGVSPFSGLSEREAGARKDRYGPNAVSSHRARLFPVLWHQLRSPLLGLLLSAALASYFVGERSDAVIIGVIVFLSVGLGFVQRVPGREGGRGAPLADPPRVRGAARRPPGPGRRHHAGSR